LAKTGIRDRARTGQIRNFSGLISRIVVIIRHFDGIPDLIKLKPALLELFGQQISLPVDMEYGAGKEPLFFPSDRDLFQTGADGII